MKSAKTQFIFLLPFSCLLLTSPGLSHGRYPYHLDNGYRFFYKGINLIVPLWVSGIVRILFKEHEE